MIDLVLDFEEKSGSLSTYSADKILSEVNRRGYSVSRILDTHPTPIIPRRRHTPHILIVDDHREIRELVSRALAKVGFRVTMAADGKAMRKALAGTQITKASERGTLRTAGRC